MKYGPAYRERFASSEEARTWKRAFAACSHTEHRHSGSGLLPARVVQSGQAPVQVAARQRVGDGAYHIHPERFVRGYPQARSVPAAVGINLALPALRWARQRQRAAGRQRFRRHGGTAPAASRAAGAVGQPGQVTSGVTTANAGELPRQMPFADVFGRVRKRLNDDLGIRRLILDNGHYLRHDPNAFQKLFELRKTLGFSLVLLFGVRIEDDRQVEQIFELNMGKVDDARATIVQPVVLFGIREDDFPLVL
jgi:hypothetical protein